LKVVPSAASSDKGADRRGSMWPSEALVSDIVGRIIEFWGFKRNMGRVWAVLYLSHEPLTAQNLRDLLRLSSGAVSMILSELSRWGVVRKVWIQGDRRDHFAAEVQLWRMISRVLSERERTEIVVFMETCEEALRFLEIKVSGHDAKDRARAQLQIERIKGLYDLARLGKKLLDGLLQTAKLDAEPLTRFMLGGGRRS
jgi:HTH-type transcriptional regulator, glycine betaine synthesis regulator